MLKKAWLVLLALPCLTSIITCANDGSNLAFLLFSGLQASGNDWGPMQRDIEKAFPRATIHAAKIFDGSQLSAARGAYEIIESINEDIMVHAHKFRNRKVIVIGYSQGGLMSRAWVEMYSDLCGFDIRALIAVGGPQAGQWGLPSSYEYYIDKIIEQADKTILKTIVNFFKLDSINLDSCIPEMKELRSIDINGEIERGCLDFVKPLVKKAVKSIVKQNWKKIYLLFYCPIFQNKISVAGFWKDPRHLDMYKRRCTFLPYINNEVDHPNANRYKNNLKRLDKIGIYYALNETIIQPASSTGFMFYKGKSTKDIEQSFKETEQYAQNLLGLKDMYDNGKLELVKTDTDHWYLNYPQVRADVIDMIQEIV